MQRAGLKPFKARTTLKLADDDTIGDRPRIFNLVCVVWERGALNHDILISQTVAVKTGLSIFVHDNLKAA